MIPVFSKMELQEFLIRVKIMIEIKNVNKVYNQGEGEIGINRFPFLCYTQLIVMSHTVIVAILPT